MLRLQTEDGWWLVTHPDHAHLAGQFASAWGNATFASPEPRAHVLRGIYAHDDGWAARDAQPVITRAGKPAAFSTELVGTYAAFEEIELASYLAVRREAVQRMVQEDPYAAILISMHTRNLLSEQADRSTIRAEDLPMLDAFLVEQGALQVSLREQLLASGEVAAEWLEVKKLVENFKLLQACDNLSLLSCVDYHGAMMLRGSGMPHAERVGARRFRLSPYPFAEAEMKFTLRARYVPGRTFASSDVLQEAFAAARVEELVVGVLA